MRMASIFFKDLASIRKKFRERNTPVRAARAFQIPIHVTPPQTHDTASLLHDGIRRKSKNGRFPIGISQNNDTFMLTETFSNTFLRLTHDPSDNSSTPCIQSIEIRRKYFRFIRILRGKKPQREIGLIH